MARNSYRLDEQGRFTALTDAGEYRTNRAGEGLWVYREPNWKQVEGTGQFSARNLADFGRKIRGRFVVNNRTWNRGE